MPEIYKLCEVNPKDNYEINGIDSYRAYAIVHCLWNLYIFFKLS